MSDTVKYIGERLPSGCVVRAVDAKGNSHRLATRIDLINHSPDGFEWGYGGSGPAQLALALLVDATGNAERAMRLHQDFKRCFIQDIDSDRWEIEAAEVRRYVANEGGSDA
jgi:hypothetical protein